MRQSQRGVEFYAELNCSSDQRYRRGPRGLFWSTCTLPSYSHHKWEAQQHIGQSFPPDG